MITIKYEMVAKGMTKNEKTHIRIFENKVMTTYNIPGKAESIVNKMKEDGRRGVIYARGAMIQMFAGKTEDEILEIVEKDIINGLDVAEKETGIRPEIMNKVVERK